MGLKKKEKVSLTGCQETKMEASNYIYRKKKCIVAQERDWGHRHGLTMVFVTTTCIDNSNNYNNIQGGEQGSPSLRQKGN